MLDTPCSKVVWRVLATHSICQFPLHFPSHASPCAITFQLQAAIQEYNCTYVAEDSSLLGRDVSLCKWFPAFQRLSVFLCRKKQSNNYLMPKMKGLQCSRYLTNGLQLACPMTEQHIL